MSITFSRPLTHLESPIEIVRQFTPNWFATTMGTGVLALVLAQFSAHPLLRVVGEGLWLANIALFSGCLLLYGARWLFYFHEARRIFGHPVMSMFLGCIPMGLATIVNGFLVYGIDRFGPGAIDIAYGLWWIDALLAVGLGILVPFMMFTRQNHAVEQMTAVWLLPIVAAEVAAVSGGLLIPHIADAAVQLSVMLASYVLWALSVPLAMSVLVILFLRMVVHKLPHAGMAATNWLALGPIGTGALAMLVMSTAAPIALDANGLGQFSAVIGGASLLAGILLWGYGLWWLASAVIITLRYLRDGVPFNLGWWGYTFPLGVYTLATLRLAAILPISAIAMSGAILAGALAILWFAISVRTLRGAWRGTLFHSPCLND